MSDELHEYEIIEPIGVEFQRNDTEGWINCVAENQVKIRLHVKAYVLVELLADLTKRLKPSGQGK
jgi:hypothetical protein